MKTTVSSEQWKKFFKSALGKEIVGAIENLRDEKIGEAMQASSQTVLPNERIVACMSQAKGIEDVLTYLRAHHVQAQMSNKNKEKEKKVNQGI